MKVLQAEDYKIWNTLENREICKKMKFKFLHELQKHDGEIVNLGCDQSIKFFHQIITTYMNHFDPTKTRDKKKKLLRHHLTGPIGPFDVLVPQNYVN